MYEGMNKGDKLLTNENRCIQFCDETPGCNSFTLCDTPMVPMFKNCHLKDRLINGSETTQYKKSCTTYYRFCGKIPCYITFKLAQGCTLYHHYVCSHNNTCFFTFYYNGLINDHINNLSHERSGAISFK